MNCCQLKIATFIHAPEGTQESFRVLVSLTVCGENLRQVFKLGETFQRTTRLHETFHTVEKRGVQLL